MKRLSISDNQNNKTINIGDGINPKDAVNKSQLDLKQDNLVSGETIKTINSNSILGSGDLSIGTLPSGGTNGQVPKRQSNGSIAWGDDNNTTYAEIPSSEITAGTSTTSRAITGRRAKEIADLVTRDKLRIFLTEPDTPQEGDIWLEEKVSTPLSIIQTGTYTSPSLVAQSGVDNTININQIDGDYKIILSKTGGGTNWYSVNYMAQVVDSTSFTLSVYNNSTVVANPVTISWIIVG